MPMYLPLCVTFSSNHFYSDVTPVHPSYYGYCNDVIGSSVRFPFYMLSFWFFFCVLFKMLSIEINYIQSLIYSHDHDHAHAHVHAHIKPELIIFNCI